MSKHLTQLAAIAAASGKRKLEAVTLHPLAMLGLGSLFDQAGEVKGGRAWKAYRRRIADADLLDPELPSTFTATLRPYQRDGYRWLMRLASLGAGACLADDMGLGKTVQALAAIVQRAPEGPSLVVTPTSVAMNWEEEAGRFAPTLRPRLLRGSNRAARDATLADLGPFDLLIVSYGLLRAEAKRLAEIPFQTAVLDEAQVIKNPDTLAARAAYGLRAAFRIATTGTPIENRLEELWSIFQFLDPGLLGTRREFVRTIAARIEVAKDPSARDALSRLIRPFVLRRTKTEVLRDLPQKTEVLLHIGLEPEEAALYEAARREAQATLGDTSDTSRQSAVRVLAALTRLRRAACHPRLLAPESTVPGSKLTAFSELLETLLANGHKALVFSQFVDHLGLIRELLDERGVAYQYLDGRTSEPKRRAAVHAFQSGEGDVFLISLRAGGFGLNLTAADFVIHMDPWWNPAVEDQASDRAHRIGQTRPVTVYRLVSKGTIEDRIVELHHSKRDLADSVLAGTDASASLSISELVALLLQG